MDAWDSFCLRADVARIAYGSRREQEFSYPSDLVFGAMRASGMYSTDQSARVQRAQKSVERIDQAELGLAMLENNDDRTKFYRARMRMHSYFRDAPTSGCAYYASQLLDVGFVPLQY